MVDKRPVLENGERARAVHHVRTRVIVLAAAHLKSAIGHCALDEQAGRIDGCTEFRLYWDVVLPVSRPMIGAFSLIAFMGSWNNFLWPQIVLHHQSRFTLPIGLNQMVGLYAQEYGSMMAGTLLAVVPVVVLFFILQKEFITGLTAGAVKG